MHPSAVNDRSFQRLFCRCLTRQVGMVIKIGYLQRKWDRQVESETIFAATTPLAT